MEAKRPKKILEKLNTELFKNEIFIRPTIKTAKAPYNKNLGIPTLNKKIGVNAIINR